MSELPHQRHVPALSPLYLSRLSLHSHRVDRVCHALVQTRQRFDVCPIEMRCLSLTLAVVERAMHGYGQDNKHRLRQLRTRQPRPQPQPHPPNSSLMLPCTLAL